MSTTLQHSRWVRTTAELEKHIAELKKVLQDNTKEWVIKISYTPEEGK